MSRHQLQPQYIHTYISYSIFSRSSWVLATCGRHWIFRGGSIFSAISLPESKFADSRNAQRPLNWKRRLPLSLSMVDAIYFRLFTLVMWCEMNVALQSASLTNCLHDTYQEQVSFHSFLLQAFVFQWLLALSSTIFSCFGGEHWVANQASLFRNLWNEYRNRWQRS